MSRYSRPAFCLLLLLALASLPAVSDDAGTLALVGATVYSSPNAAPLHDAVVLTSGGKIIAVGKRGEVQIPKNARVIDCAGKNHSCGLLE